MEEKKFITVRKEEFAVKEFVKKTFGMGKVSSIKIEYTPVGEKIVIATHKPGLIIGRAGESISRLTEVLKKKFKMENPHIDIEEIKKQEFDSQLVADQIALSLQRFGALKFKAIGYKMLERIKTAGALGCELKFSGKLPSDRAKSWRFAYGFLKKTGDAAKVVSRSEAVAETKQGVIGIKVSILAPDAKVHDRITLNKELYDEIKRNVSFEDIEEKQKKKSKTKKQTKE